MIGEPENQFSPDGVTFRIRVNDRLFFERHQSGSAWQDFDLDLTEFAGTSATIRFETDPGPQNNASMDFSFWGEIELTIEGLIYSESVDFLMQENLFAGCFFDWTATAASSIVNKVSRYLPLTDGSKSSLRERLVICAAWHLMETISNPPNPPSPYRQIVGGRAILDCWGGDFREIRNHLLQLNEYGLTDCLLLVHIWQRSGYDNALPAQ